MVVEAECMKTTEFSRTANLHLAPQWNAPSITLVGLAATAFLGRIASFVVDGPASMTELVLLLVAAVGAFACSRFIPKTSSVTNIEGKLIRIATRVATMQTIVGTVAIVLALR